MPEYAAGMFFPLTSYYIADQIGDSTLVELTHAVDSIYFLKTELLRTV